MSTPTPQFTSDETLALIAEKAKASGNPRFTVNIKRHRPGYVIGDGICTLADATPEHLGAPEVWLPMLCGGGAYSLSVFHPDEPGKRIGGMLTGSWDPKTYPPKQPDPKTLRLAEWAGPSTMLFPNESSQPLVSLQQQPQAQQPNVTLVGGNGLPTAQSPNPPQAPVYQLDPNIEAKRRELDEREASVRRVETETKIANAIEAARREFAAQLADLKAQQQPRPPDKSNVELAVALVPLVTGWLSNQAEQRKADAERAAKLVEIQIAQAQANQQMMLTLFKETSTKPGMSEETKMLFETLKTQASGSGTAEMMASMVNAMGAVSKTTLGMMEAMADMQGGDQESPIVGAMREGAKAIATLMQGTENGARKVIQQQRGPTPQLPAVQPRPPPQPPQGHATAPQAATARPQPGSAAPASTGPAQVPVVMYAPNGPELVPNQPQAFDGVPPTAQPEAVVPQPSTVDQIELAIRNHHNPDDVARVFVKLIDEKDPALLAELETHDHDPNAVIGARLGPWVTVPENLKYLEQLGAAVDKFGAEAGIWDTAVQDEVDGAEEVEAAT